MIPHIKLTSTMLNKSIIDAKKDILEQFGIEPDQTDGVETWEEPCYRAVEYYYDEDTYKIVYAKFYMTARGDKRMSIPLLRKHSEAGDYVWFEKFEDSSVYRIHITKELPLDEEQYEQLKLRYG